MNFRLPLIALFTSLATPTFAAELARVGDSVITTEQYESALKALGQQGSTVGANPELKKRFLDHMINSLIVAEQAKKEGFEKDPLYQARLADLAKQLLAGEYTDRMVEKQMTDSSLKKYFEENKADFSKKEVRASHILIATEEEAKKVLADVKKAGANFETISQSVSKDKTVDLGFFTRGRMTPEFEKAAFETPKGSIYPKPVHTPFGWHVIKVIDVKGTDKVDYAAVAPEVRAKMRASLQEKMVRGLRDKVKIATNDEELKKTKAP